MTAGTGQDEQDPTRAGLDPRPTATEHDEHEASFRERLLNISTMDGRFRTLTAIVIAQVAATSLLVLLSDYSFGDITINITGVGQAKIGVAHYVVSVVFLLTGLTLFVAGLGRADWRGVITLLAFFFLLYLLELILAAQPLNVSITIFVTIILMFVACTIAAVFIRRALLAKSPQPASNNPAVWLFLIFVPWTTIGLYAVISHPAFFYTMQFAIGSPFIVLYPFAAIDWAETADGFVKGVEHRLRLQERNGRLIIFSATAILLPIWFTTYAFTQEAEAVVYRLIVMCAFAAALSLLLWIARFRGDWPVRFAWAPTALMVAVVVILSNGGGRFVDWRLIAFFLAGLMSVALCVCGRNPQWRGLAPTALLGTLIGFTASYFALFSSPGSDIVNLIVMGAVVASLVAAIAVVVTVGWTRIRTEGIAAMRYPIQTIVTLNGSLVAVYALAVVYELMLESSERHVVEAFVIAAAVLSEVALSGHSVTNIHSDWFPRNSRLLIFFGFISFTLAYTLSNGALHGEAEQLQAYKLFLNPENAVLSGLLLMGPAALWALFILRTGRWLAGQRARLRASPPATAAQPVVQQG
jgi:hypothetical protein